MSSFKGAAALAFGLASTLSVLYLPTLVVAQQEAPGGLQPFYSPPPPAAPSAVPEVRRALPVNPPPGSGRAFTHSARTCSFPHPPAQGGASSPSQPYSRASGHRSDRDAIEHPVTGCPRRGFSKGSGCDSDSRAHAAAFSPPDPGGSGDGEIRIAPGQAGGPTITPEALQLDAANNLYLKGQFTEAAAEYEKYLGLYPDAPLNDRQSALWFMGESYRKLKRIPAAITTYETLLSQFADGPFVGPANYQLGSLYYEQKNFKAAAPLFARSATLAKSDDVLLASNYYEAICLEKLGRQDETKEIYARVLAVPGNNGYREGAHLALARLAVAQNHPNEALDQYEALAKETTRTAARAEYTIKAGLLAKEAGQIEKAVSFLSRGIGMPEAGPLRATAEMELLHLYYDASRYQKLLESYAALGREIPEDRRSEALLLVGNAQRQLGQHSQALATYEQLMTQFPNAPQVPEARYQRIISLYTTNDSNFVHEADDFLLLNADPVKADQVKLMKADTLFRKENYAAAAVAYATLENSPHLPPKYKAETVYRLGYSYLQSKQPERAIEAFSAFLKAYDDSPLAPKAIAQRALAYQQLKNYDGALADFENLIQNFRDSKEREIALEQKALILGEKEDNHGMMETFRALLKDYPKTTYAGQAHYFIGMALSDAKDFSGALSEFQAARKADAKGYGARASLRIILCGYQLQDKQLLHTEVDDYQKAKLSPAIPAQALRWLGEKEMEDKDYVSADRHLSAAAASPSNDAPDTWLKVARCRLLLKKPAEALQAADKFLENAGADPSAKAKGLLVKCEAQLGLKKYDDAQCTAEDALRLQPEGNLNAHARLLEGDIAFARGNYEDAGKAYLSISILTDDPEVTPEALKKAASALKKAGKPEDAEKALTELKTRFPNAALPD